MTNDGGLRRRIVKVFLPIVFVSICFLGTGSKAVGQMTGYVIKVDGDVVYLDVGKQDHVDSGDVFIVHQVGEGKRMAEQVAGAVRVSQVFDRVSVGRFTAGQKGAQVRVLDRVTAIVGLADTTTAAIFHPIRIGQSIRRSLGLKRFLPAVPQYTGGRRKTAYMLIGGEAVTIIGGILSYRSSNHLYDDYLRQRNPYAPSSLRLRDKAKFRRTISNMLFVVTGGVYLFGVVDSFLWSSEKPLLIGTFDGADGMLLYSFHF
jgi:hypothetical protein